MSFAVRDYPCLSHICHRDPRLATKDRIMPSGRFATLFGEGCASRWSLVTMCSDCRTFRFTLIRTRQLSQRGCQAVVASVLDGLCLYSILACQSPLWRTFRIDPVDATRVVQLHPKSVAHVPGVFRV
jgi:hypothetical protein